jgi:hypothetical protein
VRLLRSLQGANHSLPKPVHYTSRAPFCQSVVHDELGDRWHGWAMMLLPATADESRSTHDFLLLPRLSALAGAPGVVEISWRGIGDTIRNSLRAVFLLSIMYKSERVRKQSGSPEMTRTQEIRAREGPTRLHQKRRCQL